MTRVCRVRPDVPALDRTFDYLVPEAMGDAVTVGTIVRVPLQGRRVRGWVVEDGVEPETDAVRLLPLAKVVGAGPPPDVVALCEWAAWRWAGPLPLLLRAASPPNAVRAERRPERARSAEAGATIGEERRPERARSAEAGATIGEERGPERARSAEAGATIGEERRPERARSAEAGATIGEERGPERARSAEAGATIGEERGPERARSAEAGATIELVAWPPAGDRRDLVADRIARTGSTIVVVPEAARLGALRKRLERDGHRMLELHGTEPDAARTRAWALAREGRCVVVGGRVAVWAPVPDLGAVVVLDEGDEALQEERAPTWNGRDVAVERARRDGAAITLVAASPTLEAEAVAGPPVRPDRVVERDGWPIVEVVDPRDEAPGTGLLTEPLARALHHAVDGGERARCAC